MIAASLLAMPAERFSFDPNDHMLALIGGPKRLVHQDGQVVPFDSTRTYQIIFGDRSVPLLLYDSEGSNQLCAKVNPGHPVAYVFPDAAAREAVARSAYVREQVYDDKEAYARVWGYVFEGVPSASLRVQFRPKVPWGRMYNLLHRLALFVRRSDDLWPAKAQWCQKVGAQVQSMDRQGRVDWTTVWRQKMVDAGCNNVPTFDRAEWLASRVRALKPAIWLDASTYSPEAWQDVSGNGNHVTEMRNIRLLRQQAGPNGVGQSFNYVGGGSDAALRITKGWPGGKDYTFVHLTRYGGPLRGRIWNGVNGNWLSGHHGGRAGRAYHQAWLSVDPKLSGDNSDWLMTVDQKNAVRFNAGAVTGSTAAGFSPDAVGINALAAAYTTPAEWSSAPIQLAVAPAMCVDVAGVQTINGAKVQTWACHGGPNQSWTYAPNSQQLKDKNSGRCLDLPAGAVANGTQLQIWDCDKTNNNQKWEMVGDVLRKPGTNKCVDNAGGSTANGAKVHLWDCDKQGKNQRWNILSRAQPPVLGAVNHNEPSDWGVAEVLVFSGNLTAAQIQAVEAYLKEKYGL